MRAFAMVLLGVLVILAPCGWMAAASAIYCAGTGHMALYQFPYTQWLQAAPWWRLNLWMTLWVGISAALPTLLMLLLIYGAIRNAVTRGRQPNLYGETGWANRKEMRSNNINPRKEPF